MSDRQLPHNLEAEQSLLGALLVDCQAAMSALQLVTAEEFYEPDNIAIVPMGFCYPGSASSGDKPPRKECAPAWHDELLGHLPDDRLTILIGNYAQRYYLDDAFRKLTLTERVRRWSEAGQEFLPLPHPSPRNNLWLRKNPWFEAEVLPELRRRVSDVLGA